MVFDSVPVGTPAVAFAFLTIFVEIGIVLWNVNFNYTDKKKGCMGGCSGDCNIFWVYFKIVEEWRLKMYLCSYIYL